MVDEKTLDLILREARSHAKFHDRPVDGALLRAAHERMKWGPTTANSQPARIFYLFSREAREKLRPALSPVNLDKTMKAPLVAIVAYDTRFYEYLPRLYHTRTRSTGTTSPRWRRSTPFAIPACRARLSHHRAAQRGSRLRRDVGLRQCQGRRGFLP